MMDRRREGLGSLHILSDEILCHILEFLEPLHVGILACVSSVFYILCNEEPLWMTFCLQNPEKVIVYKETWKWTTLEKLSSLKEAEVVRFKRSLHFEGFSSIFLYRRWYRCNVSLEAFSFDNGQIQRRSKLSNNEFTNAYDGIKPVLLTDLASGWPAISTWSIDQLVKKFGQVAFKVSQSQGRKVLMRLEDYATYMASQHDEDPLYIFDAKFGDVAPGLLHDYKVPNLFEEDLLGVLDISKRPPFRWLVIGPPRSGASWHVDPALTSAWNTLLVGRKRWALYPPGKVPPGVVVHVDEEDGEVNFDGPSSLQWWLDVYPFLKDEEKPLECTQLPGETIFVPSGWWHCVLNIDTSIAVTQNFVNSTNLELVCLDMAPGYRHRAVARAGILALKNYMQRPSVRSGAGGPMVKPTEIKCLPESLQVLDDLASFLDDNPISFSSNAFGNSYLEARHIREWLRKLWSVRPELEEKIWKGACLAIDASTWLDRALCISTAHGLPNPEGEEQLPVGDGSNPVFIMGEYVIKFYVDEDDETDSICSLASELHFYFQVAHNRSQLGNVIPDLVTSGILHQQGEAYRAVFWDGIGERPSKLNGDSAKRKYGSMDACHRIKTRWAQALLEPTFFNKREDLFVKRASSLQTSWPYIVTRRCKGETFGNMRTTMSKDDLISMATFLGNQICHLHCLELPSFSFLVENGALSSVSETVGTQESEESDRTRGKKEAKNSNGSILARSCPIEAYPCREVRSTFSDQEGCICKVPAEWQLFVGMLRKLRQGISARLEAWGSVPDHLINQVEDYLPIDPVVLVGVNKVEHGLANISQSPVWLHMDVMDDNILVQSCPVAECQHNINSSDNNSEKSKTSTKENLQTHCILDFGDVCIGDPLYELTPIYLDVFEGNSELLHVFLSAYKLPLSINRKAERMETCCNEHSSTVCLDAFNQISYRAMCYCLLHPENVMSAVLKIWTNLKKANSWREIEYTVWGYLNEYNQNTRNSP